MKRYLVVFCCLVQSVGAFNFCYEVNPVKLVSRSVSRAPYLDLMVFQYGQGVVGRNYTQFVCPYLVMQMPQHAVDALAQFYGISGSGARGALLQKAEAGELECVVRVVDVLLFGHMPQELNLFFHKVLFDWMNEDNDDAGSKLHEKMGYFPQFDGSLAYTGSIETVSGTKISSLLTNDMEEGIFSAHGLTPGGNLTIPFDRLDKVQVHYHDFAYSPPNARFRVSNQPLSWGWVVGALPENAKLEIAPRLNVRLPKTKKAMISFVLLVNSKAVARSLASNFAACFPPGSVNTVRNLSMDELQNMSGCLKRIQGDRDVQDFYAKLTEILDTLIRDGEAIKMSRARNNLELLAESLQALSERM